MQNLCSADFFKKTFYNSDTQTQIWMSQIADGHDNFCCCNHPFAHLLASIFPPGHQDRDRSINQILIRDYTEQCHSTGEEEKGGGGEKPEEPTGSRDIKAEDIGEDFSNENIQDLLDAAAAAEEDER